MKNIFFISLNTLKEIKRHKILYALGAMIILIIGIGGILGSLSLNEQKRLSINFIFTACHLGLVFISVYFSSFLLSHEIEKKTILTLFVKPISRVEFILGKFLGLSFVLMFIIGFIILFVLGAYFIYGHSINNILFIAMWGIFLESLILSAMCFVFSSFTSSFVVLIYTGIVFIIGHSTQGIAYFFNLFQQSVVVSVLSYMATHVFPNLEKLNWRSNALYQDYLQEGDVLFASLYSFCWISLLLIITCILFQRRSIV